MYALPESDAAMNTEETTASGEALGDRPRAPGNPARATEASTPAPLPSGWVSVQGAMAIAGVSRRTIYSWLARGTMRTGRTPSGLLRIDAASLIREDV